MVRKRNIFCGDGNYNSKIYDIESVANKRTIPIIASYLNLKSLYIWVVKTTDGFMEAVNVNISFGIGNPFRQRQPKILPSF